MHWVFILYIIPAREAEHSNNTCDMFSLIVGVPKKLGGCGVCPRQIMHPAGGGYRNAQPFNDSATARSCVFSF